MAIRILWADDEIDLLKPHIMFLETKGYEVDTATSGADALDILHDKGADIIFLDENMPGLTGLETLNKIKAENATVPVIMITKSEEEEIMEDAIGSKISDYLIKPVNPNQILLSIKKNLDKKRLVSEKTTSNYMQEFRNIGMRLGDRMDHEEWTDIYKEMVYWELELDKADDEGMQDVVKLQKEEANAQFSKFVIKNYEDWVANEEGAPVLSHKLFKQKIYPEIKGEKPTFLLVIDNLRWDQWKTLRPVFERYFKTEEEESYFSILPTATHYCRNAIFSGLLPNQMERMFPKLWKNENDEGGKNLHEEEFLRNQLLRLGGKHLKFSYNKVTNLNFGKKLVSQVSNMMENDLNVVVYNFVDMLSHARTEMEVIRELADDEKAYRSLTLSWFENSPLIDIVKKVAEKGCKLIITTDHGTVKVNNASKVIGDRNTNTNLRYKVGKNLNYNKKDVLEIKNPEEVGLPRLNMSSTFIFAKEDKFFAYPNNYNHYVNYYRGTFQHGGISLEEMIVPLIVMNPK